MEFFWQFFAVGGVSFLIGVMLGRAVGVNSLLVQMQQAQQQPQLNPQQMMQMFQRPQVAPPTGNGPA